MGIDSFPRSRTIIRWPQNSRRLQQWVSRLRRPALLGTLRRISPLSDVYGFDRGTPVDRYYIKQFLTDHRSDIQGHVLEVKSSNYTNYFDSGVSHRDVLDIDDTNQKATIICDLAKADKIPQDSFDCFILTQTLQYIYDIHAALTHIRRILRPGGVLLVTVPALQRIDSELEKTDFWRFTRLSCERLFHEVFGADELTIRTYGNVLAGTAALYGIAAEELSNRELDACSDAYPLIVAIRARKRSSSV
jgi:SAM-dependent methyltransferase